MKIRVLGCSGAIAKDRRTTSFLIDHDVLVDAGTGVGDLTLEEMAAIDDVLLTHSHLDHIAALPLMVDAVAARRGAPLRVHALPETIHALKTHVFNDVIWPDFSRIPSAQAPFIQFVPLLAGQQRTLGHKLIEALPATHTVPTVGYAIKAGGSWWAFSGDTEHTPAFWARLNQLDVALLVIETAFSDREITLAQRSRHLSPTSLVGSLACIEEGRSYPIYISHTKPAETELIMAEITHHPALSAAVRVELESTSRRHDIQWLEAGQILTV